MEITFLDLGIIVVYLLIVLAVGMWLGKGEKAEGFFANNRKTKTWFLIFTVLSTNVGAGTVIGVAGSAYNTGISFALTFFLMSIVGWFILAWLAPRIKEWADKNNAYTIGDYFESRYSTRNKILVGYINIIAFILWTAAQFVAFATLINSIIGIDFLLALVVSALITIFYTAISGIKGDFYTDVIQFFVMLPVFIFLLIQIFLKLDLSQVFNVPAEFYNPYNYQGPLFFYMGALLGFPLLISSMDMWQRIFASEGKYTARNAFIGSALLKLLIIGVTIIFGFAAFQILPSGLDPDSIVFALMKELLPVGLLGIGFAGILAIIMSTVDSMIMVGAATLTKDFYLRKKPERLNKALVVGRISAVVFGFLALLIAILVPDILQIVIISTQLLLIISPAILFGLFSKRSCEKGSFWSIVLGAITIIPFLFINPNIAGVPSVLVALITYTVFFFRKEKITN